MSVIGTWFVILAIVLLFMLIRTIEIPEKKPQPQPVYRPRPKRAPNRSEKVRAVKAWLDESLHLVDVAVHEPRANAAAKRDLYKQYLWKIKDALE